VKKSELERAQREFTGNTKASADKLRARVSSDLNIVKDAYDVGAVALTEAAKLLANVGFSENPSKELKLLSAAYKDIASTLVMLRAEGRTTIAEAVASQAAETADPPAPVLLGAGSAHTAPDKISSSQQIALPPTPTPLGEFLKGVNHGPYTSTQGSSEGPPGALWLPGDADEDADEGDGGS
jgi:hypothetical protein